MDHIVRRSKKKNTGNRHGNISGEQIVQKANQYAAGQKWPFQALQFSWTRDDRGRLLYSSAEEQSRWYWYSSLRTYLQYSFGIRVYLQDVNQTNTGLQTDSLMLESKHARGREKRC